jgi:GxxExxY protein
MHPPFAKADRFSGQVIGVAIEVHRIMGQGLLESIDERCLLRELEPRGIPVLNLSCRVRTSLEQKETKATKREGRA